MKILLIILLAKPVKRVVLLVKPVKRVVLLVKTANTAVVIITKTIVARRIIVLTIFKVLLSPLAKKLQPIIIRQKRIYLTLV